MNTPVFLDALPHLATVSNRKSELYRIQRARALSDLLLDEAVVWHERSCPGCGQDRSQSGNFSQVLVPFHRCENCKSIYAARVPDQLKLDELRAELLSRQEQIEETAGSLGEMEFVSILNWIRLTEARTITSHAGKLSKVLDYRFSSVKPSWRSVVERLSENRQWTFLPLDARAAAGAFDDLRDAIQHETPDVILLNTEMDRIADPAAMLRVIRANSRPGTLVFVATSCADGLEYELLGADSPSFVPLDRFNLFSVKGFESLALGLGYEVLETSTPGRLDAVILQHHFTEVVSTDVPFWSGFFRDADRDRLHDLQILLQRSLRSGVMRFVLRT
ncbi:class I SAM-dependent methyltransferase [Thioclava sp. BHET1]|nr:class I SAM-dependent methyltransferase [Thioclava sp. BHET1]